MYEEILNNILIELEEVGYYPINTNLTIAFSINSDDLEILKGNKVKYLVDLGYGNIIQCNSKEELKRKLKKIIKRKGF